MKNEARVVTAARLPLDSPNKFPMRTAATVLKENGAWEVVDIETERTDSAAKATGPNKLAATKHKDQH